MLQTGSSNIFVKLGGALLILLLIASFALWGIGDMLRGGGGGHTLAKVGSEKITIEAFDRAYRAETDSVRRSLGSNYSPELLKRLNVGPYVLQRMTQRSLLSQEAERMGFIPDDTIVALDIRKNPAYLNASGVFDKAKFDTMLRTQGMSEAKFVEDLRMQLAIDRLLTALEVALPVSDGMAASLKAAFEQGRSVTLYKIDGTGGKPASEEELATFHREHAELFTAPETRTVSFVRFTAGSGGKADDAAVKEYYDTHRDQFRTPELREVEQLLYNDEEKAREAATQLKAGKRFADVAKSVQPMNPTSLSLGKVDKALIPSEAADKVFGIERGTTTEPIRTAFGWHIFRVTELHPEGMQPLEKVRGAIEKELLQDSASSELESKMNQLEDALAGGSTLGEVAESMGLKLEQAGAFDKTGKGGNIPELERFVETAFRTDEKTESSVITSKGGVYYLLRVDSISPEKLRPLAEVRSEVNKAYAEFQKEKAAADIASRIDQEILNKTATKEIVAKHGLMSIASGTVHRDSKTLGGVMLLPSFVQQLFATDIGSLTNPARDKDGGYVLALVSGTAEGAGDAGSAQKAELVKNMQEEMMLQYLTHLQKTYPVSVRHELFEQLMRDTSDAAR